MMFLRNFHKKNIKEKDDKLTSLELGKAIEGSFEDSFLHLHDTRFFFCHNQNFPRHKTYSAVGLAERAALAFDCSDQSVTESKTRRQTRVEPCLVDHRRTDTYQV
ncbi:Uncharacterized protein TCM_032342 [Theobroma cacao]|uniref:Uncharacterized protein n=1 Tax=Theobroma cacao TaxID=3641 RepID=A0A061FGZ3_THECC|nr:Uncharacterized protein TCM_032342 [Theobroma cacao]